MHFLSSLPLTPCEGYYYRPHCTDGWGKPVYTGKVYSPQSYSVSVGAQAMDSTLTDTDLCSYSLNYVLVYIFKKN